MNLYKRPLDILVEHFRYQGWPSEVDERKLLDRYRLTQDDLLSDQYIIEIERHRAILGDSYHKGSKMSAYETYYMRYSVDVRTGQVTGLPERVEQDVDINISDLVEEHLSSDSFCLSVYAIDENRYEIREGVSHDKDVIATLKEAETFALSLADGFSDCFDELLQMESSRLTEERRDRLHAEYISELNQVLIDKARSAWEEREEWECE